MSTTMIVPTSATAPGISAPTRRRATIERETSQATSRATGTPPRGRASTIGRLARKLSSACPRARAATAAPLRPCPKSLRVEGFSPSLDAVPTCSCTVLSSDSHRLKASAFVPTRPWVFSLLNWGSSASRPTSARDAFHTPRSARLRAPRAAAQRGFRPDSPCTSHSFHP